MISYRVFTIFLDGTKSGAAALDHAAVVEPGTVVADVGVLFISPILRADGANQGAATIRLGGNADEIPLMLLGQNFHLTPVDNEGVFITCPLLAAGTKVILLVGFALSATTPQ